MSCTFNKLLIFFQAVVTCMKDVRVNSLLCSALLWLRRRVEMPSVDSCDDRGHCHLAAEPEQVGQSAKCYDNFLVSEKFS